MAECMVCVHCAVTYDPNLRMYEESATDVMKMQTLWDKHTPRTTL
jgi:hypothetical protein